MLRDKPEVGGFLAVPDFKSLFTSDFRVTGQQAQRILNRLSRNGQMLSVVPAGGDSTHKEYLTSVIDQLDRRGKRLVLDQPASTPHDEPIFTDDQPVDLIWSELGMRLGVHARITRVNNSGRILSYEIQTDDAVYRQQRRESFRVPVGLEDGVSAALVLSHETPELAVTVKDISATGCRFGIDKETGRDAELAVNMHSSARLLFDNYDSEFTANIRIVWIEKVAENVLDFGVAWENPDEDFVALVKTFIIHKERMLLKRRTGLDV